MSYGRVASTICSVHKPETRVTQLKYNLLTIRFQVEKGGAMGTKITKRRVDAVKNPDTGQAFLWDSELPGFGLRVTPTRKTYIVQSRVAGKTVRTTIGTHGPLTPDQARREAVKLLGEMAK